MKRIFYSMLIVVLCSSYAVAQTFSVSGTVKSDVDGMPLPGVNVLVKNTNKGVVTDFDGNFSLTNVSENSVIVFTYVGFKTQEVLASANMQVSLKEDNESLDEIVLIGYGSKSNGTFPTGGSMSNYMALVMGRDAKDPKFRLEGMSKPMVVYTSELSHYSNDKNVSFAGIGRNNIRYIQADSVGRMIPAKLEEQIISEELTVTETETITTTDLAVETEIDTKSTDTFAEVDEVNIVHIRPLYGLPIIYGTKRGDLKGLKKIKN